MNISEETIDLYLRGDLSGAKLQEFNKAVASDPKLAQEVDFHRDIVDSLNSFRHQQLKSRLNMIEVPAAGTSATTGSSVFIKFAASIVTVAMLTGGTIWMLQEDKTSATSEPAKPSTLVSLQPESVDKDLKSNAQTASAVQSEKATTSQNSQANTQSTSNTKTNAKTKNTQAISEIGDMNEENFTPESINGDIEIPSMSMNDGNTSGNLQNIKINIVKEKNLGYRFYNNQLFLHGNFSNSPYEVFELNNTPSKQVYLYFEDNYYELIQGKTKLTSLNPITNKATIFQLTQLRDR